MLDSANSSQALSSDLSSAPIAGPSTSSGFEAAGFKRDNNGEAKGTAVTESSTFEYKTAEGTIGESSGREDRSGFGGFDQGQADDGSKTGSQQSDNGRGGHRNAKGEGSTQGFAELHGSTSLELDVKGWSSSDQQAQSILLECQDFGKVVGMHAFTGSWLGLDGTKAGWLRDEVRVGK